MAETLTCENCESEITPHETLGFDYGLCQIHWEEMCSHLWWLEIKESSDG